MALAAIATVAKAAVGLSTNPVAWLSIIPLLFFGTTYYQYHMSDPETHPPDTTHVSVHFYFLRHSHYN